MAKLTDYAVDTKFDSGDIFIKDGTGGTKKITVANAAVELMGMISNINRRNIYRGKNLGTIITPEQKANIANGTFYDMFIGDYWTLNGIQWIIADMNYWYNTGETSFTRNHLVMVSAGNLYNHVMNDTNTTDGGYVGSKMYIEGLEEAKTTVRNAFGDMLLTHKEYLCNAVTDGYPSGVAWYDSEVELMNEVMVYGSYIRTSASTGLIQVSRTTIDKSQLSLFRLNPREVNKRLNFWLRDPVSSTFFAFVNANGNANYSGATNTYGVRVVFAIG